ncbi:hypothetical protein RISK_004888 [Rhodopirellula islandica]|uniref:Uncharacterized protein n=1 Tax=Rhodopirellula islandica TaxID=595434 RepID=A0A0J1B8R4_RHOIS|nr:hypothetical protein RISK_004888 [Rhodopirellula islandica]
MSEGGVERCAPPCFPAQDQRIEKPRGPKGTRGESNGSS